MMKQDPEARRLMTRVMWAMFPRKESLDIQPEEDEIAAGYADAILDYMGGAGFKFVSVEPFAPEYDKVQKENK